MSQKIYTKLQQVRKRYSAKELRTIHHQMLAVVGELKGSEAKVILKLQDCDRLLVHRFIGYNSLFSYSVKALELTEHQALTYINVARKAAEIPELHDAIQKGEVTVSKARRVTAVIDNDNKEKWIGLLKTSTKAVIEKAVAEVSPRAVHHEQVRRLTKDLLELRTPLTEESAKNLTRVQDLLAQAKQRHVSREEAISEALALFIERNDPVLKAERAAQRAEKRKKPPIETRLDEPVKLRLDSCLSEHQPLENQSPKPSIGLGLGHNESAGQHENVYQRDGDRRLVRKYQQKRVLRIRLKAHETHAAALKSKGTCEAILPDGSHCEERRLLELHHLKPVSEGGGNQPENLMSLCRAHHQTMHREIS